MEHESITKEAEVAQAASLRSIFKGVVHGAPEPHRGNEKSPSVVRHRSSVVSFRRSLPWRTPKPHRKDENQATNFTDDHRKKNHLCPSVESVAISEGVVHGAPEPHRGNEKACWRIFALSASLR
ncbi:MAG: hypothetical protein D6723_06930 [Acidobacteria bacterium]|nr:MAG: hypothetical protein D6723_06930 [Acidobacteriota bacterium]